MIGREARAETVPGPAARDLLMSDSAHLSMVIRRAGAEASLRLWEGMWRVFEYTPEIPEGQQSLEEIANFLTDHLRRG